MKLIEQLYRWRNSFLKQGEPPAFIPLTAEELNVIVLEGPTYQLTETFWVRPEVFGTPVFESPFAEQMRARQISLPVTQISESMEFSNFTENVIRDDARDITRRRLTAHICRDTTNLKLNFEFDPWAAFKRRFKLTKWFPVRTKTIRIGARVLYPYIKVTLPFNKHHVQFQHTP